MFNKLKKLTWKDWKYIIGEATGLVLLLTVFLYYRWQQEQWLPQVYKNACAVCFGQADIGLAKNFYIPNLFSCPSDNITSNITAHQLYQQSSNSPTDPSIPDLPN